MLRCAAELEDRHFKERYSFHIDSSTTEDEKKKIHSERWDLLTSTIILTTRAAETSELSRSSTKWIC